MYKIFIFQSLLNKAGKKEDLDTDRDRLIQKYSIEYSSTYKERFVSKKPIMQLIAEHMPTVPFRSAPWMEIK